MVAQTKRVTMIGCGCWHISPRRGKIVCQRNQRDLFELDYYAIAGRPVDEVRETLAIPGKGDGALEAGSVGLFDLEGMSEIQRQVVMERRGGTP